MARPALRHRAVTAVTGLGAIAAWTVLPCLSDGQSLTFALGLAAPGLLVCLWVLLRPRPWLSFVAFPAALACAHFVVESQALTTIFAQLATLAAWLALVGHAAEGDSALPDASPVDWRAIPAHATGLDSMVRAGVAAMVVLTPSLGVWVMPDVEALASTSYGPLGPLALVGASLLATCVGLAFAADLLEGRAPRRRNRARLRRLAAVTVCALGVWAAAVMVRA